MTGVWGAPELATGVTATVKRVLTSSVLQYESTPLDRRTRERGAEVKARLDAAGDWSDENYSPASGGFLPKQELYRRLAAARAEVIVAADPVLVAQEREARAVEENTFGGVHVPTAVAETKKNVAQGLETLAVGGRVYVVLAAAVVLLAVFLRVRG